jgi:DNA invertase Pin-like site-specific DNA recombinase
VLDRSLNLRDLGVSAFRGKNAATGALAGFLDAVKTGRVAPGSVLVLENLDRLSRDEVGNAVSLFIGILNSEVAIVTLSPEVEYSRDSINDLPTILQAVMQFCLGHEESRKKSDRLRNAWEEKRRNIAMKPLSGKCPSWLRLSADGTAWELRPEVVALVRRIFRMAIDGFGCYSIARTLNQEEVPGFTGRPWQHSCIGLLLRNRAVLGEFRPHRGRYQTRKPTGEVLPNYYPAILDEATFNLAQQALEGRKGRGGPSGGCVANLFAGFIRDARDGKSMVLVRKVAGEGSPLSLVSSGAIKGEPGSKYVTFPYAALEDSVLKLLVELKPADLTASEDGAAADTVDILQAKVADLTVRVKAVQERLLTNPDLEELLTVLERLGAERKAAAKELEKARVKAAAAPTALVLRDCRELVNMLATATGEELLKLRTRLKARLRQLIEKVLVLVVAGPGRRRAAAVQVRFADGKRFRNYVVVPRLPRANGRARVEGPGEVLSFGRVLKRADIDLRDPADVRLVEEALAGLEVGGLPASPGRGGAA